MAYYFETSEEAKSKVYTTHYYKTNYKGMKDSILSFCKQNDLKIIDFNDEYNEGCIANEKIILNISFNIINAIKIGIDFTAEADYALFARKNVTKLLEQIYEHLAKNHQLLGIGIQNLR